MKFMTVYLFFQNKQFVIAKKRLEFVAIVKNGLFRKKFTKIAILKYYKFAILRYFKKNFDPDFALPESTVWRAY